MNKDIQKFDAVVIGAGAAGMMCAGIAGQRGKSVALIDHAKKIGEKIRISGGGRCNFTNIHTKAERFISQNPHFCKSALSQYTAHDFIALVEKHGIAYHEKKLGQLFCDESAQQIIDMLLAECKAGNIEPLIETNVSAIEKTDNNKYRIDIENGGAFLCDSLVIATGGLSIPKIGASRFGYDIARQFGHNIIETAPALVPLTFQGDFLDFCKNLSGLSVDADVKCGKTTFREGLLFTHRGLSGPSVLQISSYWKEGDDIRVHLSPDTDIDTHFAKARQENPRMEVQNILAEIIPSRLAQSLCEVQNLSGQIANTPQKDLDRLLSTVKDWHVRPAGTEGYRTAEVTSGGVDTNELNSKTMESKNHAGLYFIGEVVDVTGWLGGYNFQWAWSSGYVAGMNV